MNRWIPLVGLVVTMAVFSVWTADGLLAGDALATGFRFIVGAALAAYWLLIHRLVQVQLRHK